MKIKYYKYSITFFLEDNDKWRINLRNLCVEHYCINKTKVSNYFNRSFNITYSNNTTDMNKKDLIPPTKKQWNWVGTCCYNFVNSELVFPYCNSCGGWGPEEVYKYAKFMGIKLIKYKIPNNGGSASEASWVSNPNFINKKMFITKTTNSSE